MKIPRLKKRSRYQKARAALREMMPRHRHRRAAKSARHERRGAEVEALLPEHANGFAGLHWMTAGLFIAAGAEAALGQRRGDHRPSEAIRWAPVIAAPMAGAAQAARAIWPSTATRLVSQMVNGIAVGVGAAGLVSSMRAVLLDAEYDGDDETSMLDRVPSLAPLAFGAVGLLALLLDRDQEEATEAGREAPVRSAPPPAVRTRRSSVKRIRIRV